MLQSPFLKLPSVRILNILAYRETGKLIGDENPIEFDGGKATVVIRRRSEKNRVHQ